MKFLTQAILAALACTPALAAPAKTKSMMIKESEWTIESLKRECNDDDSKCTWTFGINPGSGATDCTYEVEGSPASEANGGPVNCGPYTITSGWSDQFGPEEGFTTLSVVKEETREIVWPAYTDKQVDGGEVVVPDQSYTPQILP
ncbi:hypothetical protein ASPVEDRAFT_37488 [Aspergillus versicolor CBS 583.65]|uniref:Small secreted protein n=1 Tax=Aspergillus versicolor CBS 583.65 TaxID=1036611 RepID=A0A1L9P989_ASPVE|nr:uncharacterized protein ASPVEDRAFT_37488 [Aspergillus versicolor CBS 583.65]OJI98055.1 hypothetical protein ASPVEDRAFT_37488 [Aspergillus versicolor CBS 583.65]